MHIVFLESLGVCSCVIDELVTGLKEKGHTVKIYEERTEEEQELIERAQGAEILVVSNIPLRKSFLDACPALKMISVAFTGLDHIDMEECERRKITVMNAAGYSTKAVAELAVGMMIAVYRKIVGGDTIMRLSGSRENLLGTELYNKTVGVVGLGAIGQRVAMLLNAFGCKVIAYNRSVKDIAGVKQVDKDTLFRESDIVTLHIPLNENTRDFVGESEFAKMKPHAILVNTARGPVVNREALYEALKRGTIAGAATDVYEQEPPLPASYELFKAPNLLMLPHMGYATKEAFDERVKIVIRNIENWI